MTFLKMPASNAIYGHQRDDTTTDEQKEVMGGGGTLYSAILNFQSANRRPQQAF